MIYLQRGFVRPVVTTLQVLLRNLKPDGHFGSKTESRVLDYQKHHIPPLHPDGIVGKQTWPALMTERDVVTVDVIDVDELVDAKNRAIAKPESTYTGQALRALNNSGSKPIILYGQSNGVATMVQQIIGKAGKPQGMVLLRIYGHGAPGSQNISAGKAALDEHVTSLDPQTFKWTVPLLQQLAPYFAPWGSMELHGCHVGQNHQGQQLLSTIAQAVQVPVTAARHEQFAGGRGQWTFDGPTVTAFPYGGNLKGWSAAAITH
jgi:peptidoglycan hydrolase-like protein with peptidoglycan-binding domain